MEIEPDDLDFKPDYRHKAAAAHLANGFTNQEAADVARVSTATIERWKRLKGFQQLVEESRSQAFDYIDARERQLLETNFNLRSQRMDLALLLLGKLRERIEGLQPEDISIRSLAGLLGAVCSLQSASEDDLIKSMWICEKYGYKINK
ncbi:MAG: hypothetical protein F6J86_36240 [Symploca sp. SIO1B1]|nr:hypothetical protein [Symploca sp. SIO1B1]